jgi:hypothetical protein
VFYVLISIVGKKMDHSDLKGSRVCTDQIVTVEITIDDWDVSGHRRTQELHGGAIAELTDVSSMAAPVRGSGWNLDQNDAGKEGS